MADYFSLAIGTATTPERLRSTGDRCGAEAYEWAEGTANGQEMDIDAGIAAAYGLAAVYCELRRLSDAAPTAEDIREHTRAMQALTRALHDNSDLTRLNTRQMRAPRKPGG